jgi:hypothetical protein
MILVVTCFTYAGKKIGESVKAGTEDQARAQEKVAELEREHPFTPPADGTLDEDQVETFFAVTDDAWEKMHDWVQDMEKRGRSVDSSGRSAGIGDAVAGLRGFGQARVALADAFVEHDMSPSAYVWTGFRLMQARDTRKAGTEAGVPQKNLDLAEKYADRIDELSESDGNRLGKAAVLSLAFTLYPRADALLPPGMPGMDSLMKLPQ